MKTRSKKRDKIDWLMEHYELWQNLPVSQVIFSKEDRRTYNCVLDNMEVFGLVCRSGKYNVNLISLIKEAREALFEEAGDIL